MLLLFNERDTWTLSDLAAHLLLLPPPEQQVDQEEEQLQVRLSINQVMTTHDAPATWPPRHRQAGDGPQ